jgi:hypothetical protein
MEATDGGRWAEGMGNASYALKIERAHRYRREVESAVSKFLKRSRRTYGITTDEVSQPGKLRLWVTLRKEPPDEISLAAGDAIHNARSALDHFVHEISSKRKANPSGTGFPIVRDESKWAELKQQIRYLPDEAQAVIEEVQPWKGYDLRYWPRERLRDLHGFDIADKHKSLNVVVAYLGRSPFGTYGPDPIPNVEVVYDGPLQLDTPTLMLQLAYVPKSDVVPMPRPDVTFREGERGNEPVIQKLTDLLVGTQAVISRLEHYL